VNTSVGAVFEAMYQTGGYWRFLGLSQVLAGALLLIPATAFYGAVRSVVLKGTVGVLVGLGVLGRVMVVTGWVRGVQTSPRS